MVWKRNACKGKGLLGLVKEDLGRKRGFGLENGNLSGKGELGLGKKHFGWKKMTWVRKEGLWQLKKGLCWKTKI